MFSIKMRDMATSLTSILFLVIAITGIMMFFHILDTYTKKMHEILGLCFVLASLVHLFANWNAMKKYFRKLVFVSSIFIVSIVSFGFIVTSSSETSSPKGALLQSMLTSPLELSAPILDFNAELLLLKLKDDGIFGEQTQSIATIAKNNGISSMKLTALILTKDAKNVH